MLSNHEKEIFKALKGRVLKHHTKPSKILIRRKWWNSQEPSYQNLGRLQYKINFTHTTTSVQSMHRQAVHWKFIQWRLLKEATQLESYKSRNQCSKKAEG